MIAFDWRGNPIDPARLLRKFNLSLSVAPNPAWHVVELRETHGRPELRQIVLGTDDSVTFFAKTNGGLDLFDLRSSMKEEGNLMNLNVKNESYYEPRKQQGPWTIRVQDRPSDVITGLGLAVDPDPQYGSNPTGAEDSRYLCVQVAWQFGATSEAPPPPTPPDPPPPPTTNPPPPFDLNGFQAFVEKVVERKIAERFARLRDALQ